MLDFWGHPFIDTKLISDKFNWGRYLLPGRLSRINIFDRRHPIYCLVQFQVGWNYVDFSHRLVKFHRPKDKTPEEYRNVTLFRTKFVNKSKDPQQYTFRTERQTKSTCSLEVQKGYTLGATTNLEFALPTAPAPEVSLESVWYLQIGS